MLFRSGHLLRILGVGFGVAVVVGGTLGSGILRAPGAVVAQLGDPILVMAMWIAGGVYSVFGAASLAELGTSLPLSGGFYVYARRALGRYPGFAIGWADWLTNCAGIAIAGITFGDLVALLAPALGAYKSVVGAGIILAFAALQLLGMRVSQRVQEATSFIKGLAFTCLIVALLVMPVRAPAAPSVQGVGAISIMAGPIALIIALQLVLQTYDGWQSALYFAGEDRDPAHNLPRSFIGGALVVGGVYLAMNLALLRVLPVVELATSTLPAADAAQRLVGARGATLITALSAFSLLPLISAVMLMGPRILYAIARDGVLPDAVGFVDRSGTPVVAMLATAGGAMALLVTRTFEMMSALSAFFAVASYSGAFLSLLVLRRREPQLPRPFRVWAFPWSTAVVLVVSLAFLAGMVASAPRISLIALIVLTASYPLYRLGLLYRSRMGRGATPAT